MAGASTNPTAAARPTRAFLPARSLLTLIAALVALAIVGGLSLRSLAERRTAFEWIEHTREVEKQIDRLQTALDAGVLGKRGFLLTGNTELLAAADRARVEVPAELATRERLVSAIRDLEQKSAHRLRRVLVVEDDDVLRDSTGKLLAGADVEITSAGTAAEALERLAAQRFDCMILDLSLPDRSGLELLEDMARHGRYSFPPVIVYTGRSLSHDDEQALRRFSHSIIIKGARSPERLLDEVTLFLHQVEAELPPERQRMLRVARDREGVFEGRRILIVEDDVRNIFALAKVLEPKGATIEIARNGKDALAHLDQEPAVDLVLMDVMMPEMDGIAATRAIRAQPRFAKLPIIALTAKAMADDRERCLAAGANDYIAKPLDVDKLLSLARVWIRK